jgi:TIR domain-containing protein
LPPDAPIAFFSYSREDSEFALRLAADLRAAGASVWIDQLDIGPGQLWDRAVQNALETCPSVLIILSPASVKSDNVMDEINFALDQKKTLIPVLYRDCDIPFRLRRFQHLDFRTEYERMLEELRKFLHLGGASQAQATSVSLSEPAAVSATPASLSPAPAAQSHEVARAEAAIPQTAAPSRPTPSVQPASAVAYADAKSNFPQWAKIAIPLVLVIAAIAVYLFTRPKPVPQTQFQLIGTGMAASQTSPPCSLPSSDVSDFRSSDAGTWFFFAYRGGTAADQWTIDWVEPNGYVHKTNTVANVAPSGRYCFPMRIAGTPAQNAPGEWTVRLNRNGTQIAQRTFRIAR